MAPIIGKVTHQQIQELLLIRRCNQDLQSIQISDKIERESILDILKMLSDIIIDREISLLERFPHLSKTQKLVFRLLLPKLNETLAHQIAIDCGLTPLVKHYTGHSNPVLCVTTADDEVFAGSTDGTMRRWDYSTGECIHHWKPHNFAVFCCCVENGYLFTGSWDKTVRMWKANTAKLIHTFEGHEGGVACVSASYADKILCSGSHDCTIRVWDIINGKFLRKLLGHSSIVTCIQMYNGMLFSGSADRTIRMWDIHTGETVYTFSGHANSIKSIAIRGNLLVSGSADRTARVWNINTGDFMFKLSGQHTSWVNWVAISFYGDTIFTGEKSGKIMLWSANTGKYIKTLKTVIKYGIHSATLSDDNQFAISCGASGHALNVFAIESV